MKMPLISVIVPVYNKEYCIRRCLDSIINQTYQNIEILIIDDGSTDASSKICKKYQEEYENVVFESKQNGGVGSARNYALNKIKGKYITYVDSDDYLHEEYLTELYMCLQKNDADICQCNFFYVKNNKISVPQKKGRNVYRIYSSIQAIKSMWYEREIKIAPWGKLYKREVWEGIRFRENYFLEDYVTTYKVFLKAKKIVYLNKELYFYCFEANSQTKGFSPDKYEGIEIAQEMIMLCKIKYPELLSASISKGVDICFQVICQMDSISESNKKQFLKATKIIKKYRLHCLCDKNIRIKSKGAILCSFFGFESVRKIYRML